MSSFDFFLQKPNNIVLVKKKKKTKFLYANICADEG
jgi:hypothetical protein